MTREEAKAIIRKEYLCVDRDCDIEKNCGRCDLMMPSKEPILQAYKMAIQALEQEPLTDKEQRIFLAAMGREEKICREVCADGDGIDLVMVCRSIERKVKKALWE